MSKRKAIVAALKASLIAATPLVPVTYWRDVKPTRGAVINLRDVAGVTSRTGNQHEHAVRIEIESQVVGEELGDLMNDELDRLIVLVGSFAAAPGVIREMDGNEFYIDAEGMDTGLVKLATTFTYRAPAWGGT